MAVAVTNQGATFAQVDVALLGSFSSLSCRMCADACRDAGFLPETFVKLWGRNAVVVGRGASVSMYVRWHGNHRRSGFSWTFDPGLFGRGLKARALEFIRVALADPSTERAVRSYRWKLSRAV